MRRPLTCHFLIFTESNFFPTTSGGFDCRFDPLRRKLVDLVFSRSDQLSEADRLETLAAVRIPRVSKLTEVHFRINMFHVSSVSLSDVN
jgi:hypothetical protein